MAVTQISTRLAVYYSSETFTNFTAQITINRQLPCAHQNSLLIIGYLVTFNTQFVFSSFSVFFFWLWRHVSVLVYHLQANFTNVCQQLENQIIKIN
jgi:hypothetical protein